MKIKNVITALLIVCALQANAQNTWVPSGSTITTTTYGGIKVDEIDPVYNKVSGNTATKAFGLYANTFSNDGGAVEVYGNSMSALSGQVHLTSMSSGDGIIFQKYNSGYFQLMEINNTTNNVNIDHTLSVANSVSVGTLKVDVVANPVYNTIAGNSSLKALGIYANSFSNDGGSVEVYGNTMSTQSGQVHLTSTSTGDGIIFQKYSSGYLPLMEINNTTNNVNIDHTLSVANSVSVGALKINAVSPTFNTITGNSSSTAVGIYANTFTTDGAGVEVFGSSYSPFKGEVHITSYGSSGNGIVLQNYDGIFHEFMEITPNGNVNVNNTLSVQGGVIGGVTTTGLLGLYANSSPTDGPNVEVFGTSHPSFKGEVHYNSFGTSGRGHVFQSYDPSTHWTQRMVIQNDGKVVIGSDLISGGLLNPTPDGYNLYVSKGILAEKIKVANSNDPLNWSDFVFDDSYNLKPLCDVESYIKSNKHLPEIPSAKEVAQDGIDVASMDAKLLQKIEELTLYVIQQQREINELKSQVKK